MLTWLLILELFKIYFRSNDFLFSSSLLGEQSERQLESTSGYIDDDPYGQVYVQRYLSLLISWIIF
jgi:hypothetical protein